MKQSVTFYALVLEFWLFIWVQFLFYFNILLSLCVVGLCFPWSIFSLLVNIYFSPLAMFCLVQQSYLINLECFILVTQFTESSSLYRLITHRRFFFCCCWFFFWVSILNNHDDFLLTTNENTTFKITTLHQTNKIICMPKWGLEIMFNTCLKLVIFQRFF